jgi:hypothetical protein
MFGIEGKRPLSREGFQELAGILDVVNSGRRTLPPDIERVCAEIEELHAAWERDVAFTLLSYDEAPKIEPIVDEWMILAQNASLGAHTLVLEDGLGLPKEPGPHAVVGGKVLEGIYAPD